MDLKDLRGTNDEEARQEEHSAADAPLAWRSHAAEDSAGTHERESWESVFEPEVLTDDCCS